MSQPIFIGRFLDYFTSDGTDLSQSFIYASLLVLSIFISIFLIHYSQFEMRHMGIKMQGACHSAIFRKVDVLFTNI